MALHLLRLRLRLATLHRAAPEPARDERGRFMAGSSSHHDQLASAEAAHPQRADGTPIGGHGYAAHREADHLRTSLGKVAAKATELHGQGHHDQAEQLRSLITWRGTQGVNAIKDRLSTLERTAITSADHLDAHSIAELQHLYRLYQERVGRRGLAPATAARLASESRRIKSYLGRRSITAAPTQPSGMLSKTDRSDLATLVDAAITPEATARLATLSTRLHALVDVVFMPETSMTTRYAGQAIVRGADGRIIDNVGLGGGPQKAVKRPTATSTQNPQYQQNQARIHQLVRDKVQQSTPAEHQKLLNRFQADLVSQQKHQQYLERMGRHNNPYSPSTIEHAAQLAAHQELKARFDAGNYAVPSLTKAKANETAAQRLSRVVHDEALLGTWRDIAAPRHGDPALAVTVYKQEIRLLDDLTHAREQADKANNNFLARLGAVSTPETDTIFADAAQGKFVSVTATVGGQTLNEAIAIQPNENGTLHIKRYFPGEKTPYSEGDMTRQALTAQFHLLPHGIQHTGSYADVRAWMNATKPKATKATK